MDGTECYRMVQSGMGRVREGQLALPELVDAEAPPDAGQQPTLRSRFFLGEGAPLFREHFGRVSL